MRNFPFFISFKKFSWVGAESESMKILDKLCFRTVYRDDCMSAISQYPEMGMYHKPYILFLCPFKISVLFLEY